MGFYSLFLFICRLRLLIHMLLSISNFWSMFLFIHLRNLFIQELNIPDHRIDSSIFGFLSRNVDSTHGIFEKLLLLWWTRPSMVFIIFSITLLGWSHPLMNIIPWAYPFVDLYSLDHPLGWTYPLVDLYSLNHPLGWYCPLVDLIIFSLPLGMNLSTYGLTIFGSPLGMNSSTRHHIHIRNWL